MLFMYEGEVLSEQMLNYIMKITMPSSRSVSNQLGPAFVPNGISKTKRRIGNRAIRDSRFAILCRYKVGAEMSTPKFSRNMLRSAMDHLSGEKR